MSHRDSGRRALLFMIAFAGLWAAVDAMEVFVLGRHSVLQVVWLRFGVHLLLMLAVWGWREPASLWRTRMPGFQLLRSLALLGMPVSWQVAMGAGIRPDTLMAVFWLSPVLILLMLHASGAERVSPVAWAAVGAGSAGAWILHPPAGVPMLAAFAGAAGMALSFSLFVVMTRAMRGEGLRANLFHAALGVFVVLTPVMPAVWVPPNAGDALVLVAIGGAGFLALYALERAAREAPLSVTTPVVYLQIPLLLGLLVASGAHGGTSPRRAAVAVSLFAGTAFWLWARASQARAATARVSGVDR